MDLGSQKGYDREMSIAHSIRILGVMSLSKVFAAISSDQLSISSLIGSVNRLPASAGVIMHVTLRDPL